MRKWLTISIAFLVIGAAFCALGYLWSERKHQGEAEKMTAEREKCQKLERGEKDCMRLKMSEAIDGIHRLLEADQKEGKDHVTAEDRATESVARAICGTKIKDPVDCIECGLLDQDMKKRENVKDANEKIIRAYEMSRKGGDEAVLKENETESLCRYRDSMCNYCVVYEYSQ
jgi:hypothetical protein